VLRYPDGGESDVTFLGAVSPGQGVGLAIGTEQFGAEIEQWLGAGQGRDARWLVPDEDSADGTAVDVVAWLRQA